MDQAHHCVADCELIQVHGAPHGDDGSAHAEAEHQWELERESLLQVTTSSLSLPAGPPLCTIVLPPVRLGCLGSLSVDVLLPPVAGSAELARHVIGARMGARGQAAVPAAVAWRPPPSQDGWMDDWCASALALGCRELRLLLGARGISLPAGEEVRQQKADGEHQERADEPLECERVHEAACTLDGDSS
jgi:hypothetical protein